MNFRGTQIFRPWYPLSQLSGTFAGYPGIPESFNLGLFNTPGWIFLITFSPNHCWTYRKYPPHVLILLLGGTSQIDHITLSC